MACTRQLRRTHVLAQLALPNRDQLSASTPAVRMPAECCRRRACGIQLLTLQDHAIASPTNFVDVRLFTAFDLPQLLPAQDVPLRSATAALKQAK